VWLGIELYSTVVVLVILRGFRRGGEFQLFTCENKVGTSIRMR
jgi:hypothetical protein